MGANLSKFRLNLRFIDSIFLGYLLLIPMLLIIAPHPVETRPFFILTHLLVAAGYCLLIWADGMPGWPIWIRWVHDWFPLLAVGSLYSEATYLNNLFMTQMLDPVFTIWDAILFGAPLVQQLAGSAPLWIRESMHAVYFSFYLYYILPPLLFYRQQRAAFHRYVTGVLFVEIFHYLLILLIPAIGPLPLRTEIFDSGWFFIPLMDHIYAMGEYGGAAFPSAHVAVSLFLSGLLFARATGWIRALLILWFLGISFSTVFCGYHYGVDVFGGLVSGSLSLLAFRKLAPRLAF